MKNYLSALLLLPLLSACSGGGANAAANGQVDPSQAIVQSQSPAMSEAQSDALSRTTLASVPSTSDLLYISNVGNNSVTVYQHDASGNTSPKYVIAGSKTGLKNAGQLSADAQGNLYVANGSAILVFAHGADGNVAPIRTLSGSLTGIHQITAMTVDQKTGKIFVADYDGNGVNGTLLRFPPNAAGNTAPFARSAYIGAIKTLASDSTGNNLITAQALGVENIDQQIITLAKQFANGTAPKTVAAMSNYSSSALADDPTTKSYLVIGHGGGGGNITRLAENTSGYGDNTGHEGGLKPAPVSSIASDTCGSQLALGYLRNIYVTHSTTAGCSTDAVYVYTHDAVGNAIPLRILSGLATKLDKPAGIYEGQ